jgi:transposase
MRFYKKQHKYYCGIDLHTSVMYVCVTNEKGEVLVHKNLKTDPQAFTTLIEPYREDVAVAVECVFVWYWLADLCNELGLTFVLGHALYMKAIHGGKVKNDKIDSMKIADLLRGGTFPIAYAYPKEWRSTRDLLRRRLYLSRRHSELSAHIQNTTYQCNLPHFGKRLDRVNNRQGLPEYFDDPLIRKSIATDSFLMEAIHTKILDIESTILATVVHHDQVALHLLQSVPGIGKILALVILYEVEDINRFPKIGNFISYARLIKCAHESAGKRMTGKNSKIGNVHLKWAFSEAACLFLRANERGKNWHQKLVSKYGKAKSLSIISQRIGRAVYTILKKRTAFDEQQFYESLNV